MLEGGGAVEAPVPAVEVSSNQGATIKAEVSSKGQSGQSKDAATAKAVVELANELKADEKSVDAGTSINPEDRQEIDAIMTQVNEDSMVFPEADSMVMTAIAAAGNLPKNLELNGRIIRQKAEGMPTEGEEAPSNEQRSRQIAFGYDVEIGGLEIKLSQIKNKDQRKVLSEQIKTLKQEKIDKTGVNENQLNGVAKMFDVGGDYTKYITGQIEQGTPMVAVAKVLETAIVNKDVRTALITNLKNSERFSEDQIKMFERNLNNRSKMKKVEKVGKIAGIGSLIGMILMIYSGFKKKEPGMG